MPAEKITPVSLTGGCQCGEIRYAINAPPLTFYCCHCTDCQQQSSSGFGMSVWVSREAFSLTRGELAFWETRGESGAVKRCAFCSHCGSRLYHCGAEPVSQLSIKGGSIDQIASLSPIAHIWARSAQPWINLSELPGVSFEKEPPDDQTLIDLWCQEN